MEHPPISCAVPTPEAMIALGAELARVVRAGDLLLLAGELGAGKTTLVRGLGQGLGVRGEVTSPTFVLARVHPSATGGLPLVHVDAYRLEGLGELDDLDLDASLEESVTVVEWGAGKADGLSQDRLYVRIARPGADAAGELRTVTLAAQGARWAGVDLQAIADRLPH